MITKKQLYLYSLCLILPLAGKAGPEIECKNPVHNFGTVDNRQNVEHAFIIENPGDETLDIGRPRACCGATINIDSRSIEPGTSAELRVKLSLKGKKGKQRKSFYIVSNDPAKPYYQFLLKGVASAAVEVSPRSVFFGEVLPDVSTNRTVSIKAREGYGFNITNIVSTDKHFEAIVKKTGGRDHTIEIRTCPLLQSGVTRGRILVNTDKPGMKPVSIGVSAEVSGAVLVVPSKILLSEPTYPAERVSRRLAVRSRKGKSFKILKITAPDPEMDIEYDPIGKHGYLIKLNNFVPSPGLDKKELVILTDHPGAERIKVKFSLIDSSTS
ncbi:MAG: DUF1573 domain-containing protein [Verrucomicrobiota bacterium]